MNYHKMTKHELIDIVRELYADLFCESCDCGIEIEELENEITEKDLKIFDLETEVEELKDEIRDIQNEIKDLKSNKPDLQKLKDILEDGFQEIEEIELYLD